MKTVRMSKKAKYLIVGAVVLICLVIGALIIYQTKYSWIAQARKPDALDQDFTAEKIIEQLSNDSPQFPSPWGTELHQKYDALEGCEYVVQKNSLDSMTSNQKVNDFNGSLLTGEIKVPIAVEKLETPLICNDQEKQTLTITYYALMDGSSYSVVDGVKDVEVFEFEI